MARVELDAVVRRASGSAVSGASAYVYTRGTTSQVSVYAASAGGSPLTQPLTTDASGRIDGWVESPASLDLTATSAADTYTQPYEAISGTDVGGRELGYAEITSTFTTTSAAYVDVTGLSVTVTIGARPVTVIFSAQGIKNTTAAGNVALQILEGATAVGVVQLVNNDAGEVVPAGRLIRRNPAAGSTTYKVQIVVTSGTGSVEAATTSPASISVVER